MGSIKIDPRSFWDSIARMPNARDSFLIRKTDEEYNRSGQIHWNYLLKSYQEKTGKTPSVVMEYGCGDGRVAQFAAAPCRCSFLC